MSALKSDDPWAVAYRRKAARAYDLFKLGWDTSKIAAVTNTTEDRALKYVSIGRSYALGLPVPYEGVE